MDLPRASGFLGAAENLGQKTLLSGDISEIDFLPNISGGLDWPLYVAGKIYFFGIMP
jgi:hypothetical protein